MALWAILGFPSQQGMRDLEYFHWTNCQCRPLVVQPVSSEKYHKSTGQKQSFVRSSDIFDGFIRTEWKIPIIDSIIFILWNEVNRETLKRGLACGFEIVAIAISSVLCINPQFNVFHHPVSGFCGSEKADLNLGPQKSSETHPVVH